MEKRSVEHHSRSTRSTISSCQIEGYLGAVVARAPTEETNTTLSGSLGM